MRSWIALLLLMAIVYSVPLVVQTEAEIAQHAFVPLVRTMEYTITIVQSPLADVPEVVGRTYTVSVSKETTGLFVNSDGTLVASDADLNSGILQTLALGHIQSAIVRDLATVEHVKKFGGEPPSSELPAYARYFENEVGTLAEWYAASPDSLTLQPMSDEFTVQLGTGRLPAELLGEQGGRIFLAVDGLETPAVEVSNPTIEPGDTVYVVPPSNASAIETAVVQTVSADKIELDRPVDPLSVVLDEIASPIAIGDGAAATSGPALADDLAGFNLSNSGSIINDLYREALDHRRQGNAQIARQKLQELLGRYPYHSGAQIQQAELNEPPSILSRIERHPWTIPALIGAGLLLVLFIVRRLFR